MKAFIFGYRTNYDLGVAIVYANSKEEAIEAAERSEYIWDTDNVHEIDLNSRPQVIIIREFSIDREFYI